MSSQRGKGKRGQTKQSSLADAVKEIAQDAVKRLSGTIQGVLTPEVDAPVDPTEASAHPKPATPAQQEHLQGFGLLSQEPPTRTPAPAGHTKLVQWPVRAWLPLQQVQVIPLLLLLLALMLAYTQHQSSVARQMSAKAAVDLAALSADVAARLEAAGNTSSRDQQHATGLATMVGQHAQQLDDIHHQLSSLSSHIQELQASADSLASLQREQQHRLTDLEQSSLRLRGNQIAQQGTTASQQPTPAHRVPATVEHHTQTSIDNTHMRRLHRVLNAVLRGKRTHIPLPSAQLLVSTTGNPAPSCALPLVSSPDTDAAHPSVTLRISAPGGSRITGMSFDQSAGSGRCAAGVHGAGAGPAAAHVEVQAHSSDAQGGEGSWLAAGTLNITTRTYHALPISNVSITRVRLRFTGRSNPVMCIPHISLYE